MKTKMQSWVDFHVRRSKTVDKEVLKETIGGVITDFGNSILSDYADMVRSFPEGSCAIASGTIRDMIIEKIKDFSSKEIYE